MAELTPNQRGLILGACAQVCNLSDQMHAEMEFLATSNESKEELANWQRIKESMEQNGTTNNMFYTRAVAIVAGGKDQIS